MTVLSDFSSHELEGRLKRGDLRLQAGPFRYSIQSAEPKVLAGLRLLYPDFTVFPEHSFSDFHIALRPANLRQKLRGVVEFFWDGRCPFEIIEIRHSYAFLEWGMNWCVAVANNHYLKIHAAVLEKNNSALILPGLPGSGKSTLCAALALSGWRLLSDEHALVPLGTSSVVPLCRPISLKNESIDIIRSFSSDAVISEVAEETHKGRVAHLKADLQPHSHDITPVPARLMVFPEYGADSEFSLRTKLNTESFMFAGYHSFNYKVLGERGFETLSTLMSAVDCFDLRYSNLDQAMSAIDHLESELLSE